MLCALGCTHVDPHRALAHCRATLMAADALPSSHVGPAAEHLEMARRHHDLAVAQLERGDDGAAHLSLVRAEADAQLALALASEHPARAAAQDAQDHLQAINDAQQGAPHAPASALEREVEAPAGATHATPPTAYPPTDVMLPDPYPPTR